MQNLETGFRVFQVVGQPGIGRSLFLLYAIVMRMMTREPTCLQLEPDFFVLFCEDGAFQFSTKISTLAFYLTDNDIYFVGSNVEPSYHIGLSNARIVEACLPRLSDWTRKINASLSHQYRMRPFLLTDIIFACVIFVLFHGIFVLMASNT